MTFDELQSTVNGKLKIKGISLSNNDFERLLFLTTSTIDRILDEKGSLTINDFGVFSRRNLHSKITNFKPADRLSKRLNNRK